MIHAAQHEAYHVHISGDIANALAGIKSGFRVRLDCLPKYTFYVEATTPSEAHGWALKTVEAELGRQAVQSAKVEMFNAGGI